MMGTFYPGYSTGGFEALFGLMSLAVVGVIIFVLVKGVSQWNKNNSAPRLSVEAQVVSRRTDITRHSGDGHGAGHTTTWHYVTFQVESGDRMEFSVSGSEYGMLAEGDRGKLTFQGTRYLGFERRREQTISK